MATNDTIKLDPQAEAQFLDVLLATARTVAQSASGPQLAVVGHYQTGMEQRLAKLRRSKKPKGRRAMVAA